MAYQPFPQKFSLGIAGQDSLGGGNAANTPPVMNDYGNFVKQQQPIAADYQQPIGITDQMKYVKGLSTAYTPEQELAMKNRIRATDTAQNAGATARIRDLMASQGLSGSGAETAALGNMMRGQNATRQSALSNLDISNAQTDLTNQYNRAGMLNQLTNTGENARQFDTNANNSMFQWGKQFDWQKYMDQTNRQDYLTQLQDLYKKLGLQYTGAR